jgi:hypothetical protein
MNQKERAQQDRKDPGRVTEGAQVLL